MATPTSAVSPLCVAVTYQGHGASGTARWALPVQVTVSSVADNSTIAAWTQTTDTSGRLWFLPSLPMPSAVNVAVKNSHALGSMALNVPYPWGVDCLGMPTLLEGDANNNDQVSITDFSILRTAYGQTCPACDARSDFNEDGQVSITDFSLLRSNYARSGPSTSLLVAGRLPDDALPFGSEADGQLLFGSGPSCGTAATVRFVPLVPPDLIAGTAEVAIYVDVADGKQADSADVTITWDDAQFSVLDIAAGSDFPVTIYKELGLGAARFASGSIARNLPAGSVHVATAVVRARSWSEISTPFTVSAAAVSCAGSALSTGWSTNEVSRDR